MLFNNIANLLSNNIYEVNNIYIGVCYEWNWHIKGYYKVRDNKG